MRKLFKVLSTLAVVAMVLMMVVACGTTAAGSTTTDPILPKLTDDTGWWIDTTGTMSYETMQALKAESDSIDIDGFALGGVIFDNAVSEPMEICTKFGASNGIGNAKLDNGLAICIFASKLGKDGKSPAIALAVGSGLEATLNDAKAGRFLDTYFIPAKNEGHWEKGVVALTQALHKFLKDPMNEEFKDPPMDPMTIVWLIIFFIAICILVGLDGKYNNFAITSGIAEAAAKGVGGGFSGGGASR